jgi:predicted ATPase/DNA-binding CsgD family transcriptional regulator
MAPSGLVGRDRERTEIAELIAGARLVTLLGAGGCGKTRLALEVADELSPRFPDGVGWVDLGSLDAPSMVPTAVAAAIGVHERVTQDLVETLVEALGEGEPLLVLDNCEHLVDASAALAASLLTGCPRLRVLATSREPLAVRGEAGYVVTGLSVPPQGVTTRAAAVDADAVRLFELRARQVRSDFRITDDDAQAVGRICRHLDGIPLAVELAAARVRVLSPQQIADGLADRFGLLTGGARDAPARQRTLEASVQWSYDLLEVPQQRALTRLSVFAGTFGLTAAGHLAAGPDLPAADVLDLVSGLVDRSLLQAVDGDGEVRYRMLETIRAYARQRLLEIDEPERVRHRHLDHYVGLAHEAQAGLLGPEPDPWIVRLRGELDDLRVAMDWAVVSKRGADVLDIVEATFSFWMVQGLYVEMSRRLHAAVDALPGDAADSARGLMAASLLTMMGGDHPAGHALADEAVRRSAAHGDEATRARALIYRAWCGSLAGTAIGRQIAADMEEGIALAEQTGEQETRVGGMMFSGALDLPGRPFAEGHGLLERAVAEMEQVGYSYLHTIGETFLAARWLLPAGDLERACEHAEAALAVARRLGLGSFVSTALSVLGGVATLRGDESSARAHLGEALSVAQQGGLRTDVMIARDWLAHAEDRFGTPADARVAAESALDAAREVGSRPFQASAERLLGVVALREERLESAGEHLSRARHGSREPRNVFTLGRSLLALAELAAAREEPEQARDLAHEGLEVLVEHADRPGIADALETLAAVHTAYGQHEPSLRLVGAAERFRAESGIGRFPLQTAAVARCLDAAGRLDVGEVDAARQQGAVLSLDEAVAYARRGRGGRGRPATGWDALTPTERDVVRLVARGCSNAEVGEQLFISVNTVKTHLSHVYEKVRVSGRADLVAQAAQRDL